MRALYSNDICLEAKCQAPSPIHGTLDIHDKSLCLARLPSCPVTGVILGSDKAGPEKKRTLFHVTIDIQDKSLCL